MRALLIFPVNLMQSGGIAALLGSIVAMVYLALGIALLRFIFWVANYAAVKPVNGVATVIKRRIIGAHKEWQGRYIVIVPESKVLDLSVHGQNVTFIPAEWIYERSIEEEEVPVF
jgi:hypothetical protein